MYIQHGDDDSRNNNNTPAVWQQQLLIDRHTMISVSPKLYLHVLHFDHWASTQNE